MKYTYLFLLLLTLAACGTEESSNEPMQAEMTEADDNIMLSQKQFEAAGMDLTNLSEQPFYESIIANGMFEVPPKYQSSVSAYYGGYVKQFELLPGEAVRRGQVLFTLENPSFINTQREFLEAKSQMNYLASEYERLQTLAEENVTAKKNFLKAEADYNRTKVQFAALKKELELMRIDTDKLTTENIRTSIAILAPISGYATDVMVTKGQLLSPEEEALHIINTNHLHLELSVFEKDLAKIKKEQTIRFTTPNLPHQFYEGEVYLINRHIDPQTRKLAVHGHLKNEKDAQLFSPGSYIEGEILTSSKIAMALPTEAVVEMEGVYYVLQLESADETEYSFTQKMIKVGAQTDDFVEVLNAGDFPEGARFLGKGAFGMILE